MMKLKPALIMVLFLAASSILPEAQAQPKVNYEKIRTLSGYEGDVLSLAISPDAKYLATGMSNNNVLVWDMANWRIIATLAENDGDVNAVAFSPDGKLLASGHVDKKAYLWDTTTWKRTTKIMAEKTVNALAFSQNGNVLAIASDDDGMLWDVKKNKLFKTLKGHDRDIRAIAYSPDGTRVATGSNDNTVILWDAASGDNMKTLSGHQNNVNAVVFSGDGKYLLSGSNDNSLSIWDAKTGNLIGGLAGHANGICTVSFLPNSHTAISGDCMAFSGPFGIPVRTTDSSCKFIFWDVESAKKIRTIESDCGLSCTAFSPDGKYFVAGFAKGDRFISVYERK